MRRFTVGVAYAVLSVPTWATDVLRLLKQQGRGMASTSCGGPRLLALGGAAAGRAAPEASLRDRQQGASHE